MYKLLRLFVSFVFLIELIGCSGVSNKEHDALKAEYEKLKLEIEDLKFGPDRLLKQAKGHIESNEYALAKSEIEDLISRHPTSEQSAESKILLTAVEKQISEQIIKEEKERKEQELANEKEIAAKEKLEKERLSTATKKMNKKYDEINEVTWYRDKTSPSYVNYNGFYAYIGQSNGGSPWLRLAIQYAADDWLFIENYIIKVDGMTYNIVEQEYGEIKADNGSGGIWEWLDRQVGPSEFEIIKAVANGKDVKIRFSGKDYHKDKTITSQQKLALKNVLNAYEALGGSMN